MSSKLSVLYTTVHKLCEELMHIISEGDEFSDIAYKYSILENHWKELVDEIETQSAWGSEYTNIVFTKTKCDRAFMEWKHSKRKQKTSIFGEDFSDVSSHKSKSSNSSVLQIKERLALVKKKKEHALKEIELSQEMLNLEYKKKQIENKKRLLKLQLEEDEAEIRLATEEEAIGGTTDYLLCDSTDKPNLHTEENQTQSISINNVDLDVRQKTREHKIPIDQSNKSNVNLPDMPMQKDNLDVDIFPIGAGASVNSNYVHNVPVSIELNHVDNDINPVVVESPINVTSVSSYPLNSVTFSVSTSDSTFGYSNAHYAAYDNYVPISMSMDHSFYPSQFSYATSNNYINRPLSQNVCLPDNTFNMNTNFVNSNVNNYDIVRSSVGIPVSNLYNNSSQGLTYTSNISEPISHVIHPQSYLNQNYMYDVNRNSSNQYSTKDNINGNSNTDNLVQKLCQIMSTPKLEFMKFNGNAMKYVSFIHNFETLLEANNPEDSRKLQLLIQHCEGKAREAVESCVNLPVHLGYKTARKTLYDNFGRPHIIAKANVDNLLGLKEIKSATGFALMEFVRELENCERILFGMGQGYNEELNQSSLIRELNKKLPYFLRAKWTDVAGRMIANGYKPRFRDFIIFVKERAEIVNNEYGEDLAIRKSDKSNNNVKTTAKDSYQKRTVLLASDNKNNVSNEKSKCVVCLSDHPIWRCSKFLKLNSNERLKTVKEKELCEICLNKHKDTKCNKTNFKCKHCGKEHNTLIHITTENNSPSVVTAATGAGNKICIGIIPVKVRKCGSEQFIQTYALQDTGSELTLISQELIDTLQIPKRKGELTITGMTGTEKLDSDFVDIIVESIDDESTVLFSDVRSVPKLPISSSNIPEVDDLRNWPHLNDIPYPDFDIRKVMMLIGVKEKPSLFLPLEFRKGLDHEPVGIRYKLGWMVLGSLGEAICESYSVNLVTTDTVNDNLKLQLNKLWDTDFRDLQVETKPCFSIEDKRALELIENSLKLLDGHFQVGLPWRSYPPSLPNNRELAVNRLHGLSKRFHKDPELFGKYQTTITEYILKGHAEKIPDTELYLSDRPLYYLPHHPVTHPLKPEKVRVVFDCAAKYKGTSLNQELLQGPHFANELLGVLFQFRIGDIAFVADVEAHFHQVFVEPIDCDVLRFLWWKNNDLNGDIEEYRMKKHIFGATSSPAIANYCVKKCAELFGHNFNDDTVRTVTRNMYVDDMMKSVDNLDLALTLYKEVTALLNTCGFRLTKWCSNNRELLSHIPENDRVKSIVNLELDELPIQCALGLKWNTELDVFTWELNEKILFTKKPATRRGILSIVYSLFDPIGFISPYVMKAKLMLQTLSRLKLNWDEDIGVEYKQQWNRWLEDLFILPELKVERCLKPKGFTIGEDIQLHIFSDASRVGYSAVSYIRFGGEKVHCAFMYGKCRLAPIKEISIPRLELSAAVLSVKMKKVIVEELDVKISQTVFWTDSMSVLKCINNQSKRFHTFESNRLTIIHAGSSVGEWRYIDRNLNPADDGSKGLKLKTLIKNKRWLNGPLFLHEPEELWPTKIKIPELESTDPEVRKENVIYAVLAETKVDVFDELFSRYSSWFRLKRGIAWLLRYKAYLRSKVSKQNVNFKQYLEVDEIERAELSIIRLVQLKEFPKGESEACLKKLSPKLVDGLLRVKGRLENAPIEENTKHPLILPYKQQVTELVIRDCHENVGHLGQESVLSALRNKFWVVKGRSAVRKVVRNCVSCQKQSKKTEEQFMGDLPQQRLTPDKPPFNFVGVDYFGPLMVKQGRSTVKRYGCLFTCYTTRAVHVEIVHSLDTDGVINAVRRFISLRGYPQEIRSDNGTNFTKADKELADAVKGFNESKLNNFCLLKSIKWSFNPPAASHMGGIWERVIQTVKRIIKSVIGIQLVTDEVLSTVTAEAVHILNNRPLTRVSDDVKDEEPLTPNHLLHLRQSSSLPPGLFVKEDLYLKRKWRQVQYLTQLFWKRWIKEYIPTLMERSKWIMKRKNVQVNDIVLLADENFPRGQWPLARVVEVIESTDGLVRTVKVKTSSTVATSAKRTYRGESKDSSIILTRPITKIVLLELYD